MYENYLINCEYIKEMRTNVLTAVICEITYNLASEFNGKS